MRSALVSRETSRAANPASGFPGAKKGQGRGAQSQMFHVKQFPGRAVKFAEVTED